MTTASVGAAAGAVLAIAWVVLGFWAFVLVAVAMLVGAGIGRIVDGRLDVRAVADAFRGRRSSS
ncbi:DUF2273 domain-containing protein [Microbacterium protaetiae]|uniref:DUF2273 domain-containing protein n=1 Tax=Microbacterium protaetiae TaxID=2509458 RepID=A0A4P6EDW8_9MICO|nr:DUF2273 domain-containing protein [Microbacterium protaetiae]QAY60475.1 DUF2273 domain-containing protein [Microbacterium protaetiae]